MAGGRVVWGSSRIGVSITFLLRYANTIIQSQAYVELANLLINFGKNF